MIYFTTNPGACSFSRHFRSVRRHELPDNETIFLKGCFVASLAPNALDAKRSALANEKLAKDVEYYKTLGLSLDEIVALIKRNYGDE
jgi:DNA-binding transcriptional regulator YhcF (GntR family)